MVLKYSSVFYIEKNGTNHTIQTMYRQKNGEGTTKVWSLDDTGGNATDNSYFIFTLLEDDTYSIKAADFNNMPLVTIIPSEYEGKPVTTIAELAFADGVNYGTSPAISTVVIPDSITSIGNFAFSGCTSLYSVVLSQNLITIGEGAFSNTPIPSMKLPNTVTSIGASAFAQCHNLSELYIPDSVTSVGSELFYDAYNKMNVTAYCEAFSKPSGWADNWAYISAYKDANVVWGYITEFTDESYFTFTELADGTYSVKAKDTSNLPDKVVVPDTYNGKAVTAIDAKAFQNATTVTKVVILSGVTSIGYKAFDGCSALVSIVIPDTVTTIGNTAFQSCTALTDITLPSGITTIEDFTFFNCTALPSITIPDSVTSIGELAFAHCEFTSIVIPSSVTEIGSQAFFNCANLTINCEASSQPEGWASDWNSSNRPVVWGYTG